MQQVKRANKSLFRFHSKATYGLFNTCNVISSSYQHAGSLTYRDDNQVAVTQQNSFFFFSSRDKRAVSFLKTKINGSGLDKNEYVFSQSIFC